MELHRVLIRFWCQKCCFHSLAQTKCREILLVCHLYNVTSVSHTICLSDSFTCTGRHSSQGNWPLNGFWGEGGALKELLKWVSRELEEGDSVTNDAWTWQHFNQPDPRQRLTCVCGKGIWAIHQFWNPLFWRSLKLKQPFSLTVH